jgi:CheY-like chemotaxis protein
VASGYQVLEAGNAADALELIEGNQIRLLLSDLTMPGHLDGWGLAREVRLRNPEIEILLTSGFPGSGMNDLADKPNVQFLAKPFRREELAKRIRSILDKGESHPTGDPVPYQQPHTAPHRIRRKAG